MRFLLLLALLAVSGVQAAAIERFKSFVGKTQSARADFEQKVFDRDRKLVQEAKGSFVLLRPGRFRWRSEEHTSELQSPCNLVCRLLLEKKKKNNRTMAPHDRIAL